MALSESNMPKGGPVKISGAGGTVKPKRSTGAKKSFYVAPKGKGKGGRRK